MVRPDRRYRTRATPLSGRYLTRLLVMSGFCMVAMILLRRPRGEPDRTPREQGPRYALATVAEPSPFAELGDGVFLSEAETNVPQELPTATPAEVASTDPEEDRPPQVDRQLIGNVLDRTDWLNQRPYYHLVTVVCTSRARILEKYARRDITFAHLWSEPEKHRGELIYLKGYL